MHFAEREAAMKAYIEAGGDAATYKITPDEEEEAFKAEMTIIKEKRARLFMEQEKEKAENLNKKLAMSFRPFKVKLFTLKTFKSVKILKISELPAFSIADL